MSRNARHTVLGEGTKVWFQILLAATSCHTTKNTTKDSSGRAARVSRPRHLPDGTTLAGKSSCGSSGAMSTKTDTAYCYRIRPAAEGLRSARAKLAAGDLPGWACEVAVESDALFAQHVDI